MTADPAKSAGNIEELNVTEGPFAVCCMYLSWWFDITKNVKIVIVYLNITYFAILTFFIGTVVETM